VSTGPQPSRALNHSNTLRIIRVNPFHISPNGDGAPFTDANSGTIRFHAEDDNKVAIGTPAANSSIKMESAYKIKLDMRFKVAKMMYDRDLEY